MEKMVVPSLLLCAFELLIIAYLYHTVHKLRKNQFAVKTNEVQPYSISPTLPHLERKIPVIDQHDSGTLQSEKMPVFPVVNEYDQRFMERLRSIIKEEMTHGKVDIETLADRMCISRSQLNRRVKALTGLSTSNYSIQLRLMYACEQLINTPDVSVNTIALHCGFDDAAYFARIFKQRVGMPPSVFRKNKNAIEQMKVNHNE
ncbi:MAG: AraC family transcriptional regulator [Prevotella sp.]|nr:AraC family transcriptional regulator [Prevotella sp.]